MDYSNIYQSIVGYRPFLRVDFGDIEFIHEVLLATATSCCYAKKVINFEIRIGEN